MFLAVGGRMGLVLYRGRAAKFKATTELSHLAAHVGKIALCMKCGSYAEFRWRGLARSCPRRVPAHAIQAREQLLRGRHPRHNVFIARPLTACMMKNSKTQPLAAPCAKEGPIERFGVQLPDRTLLEDQSAASSCGRRHFPFGSREAARRQDFPDWR